ncbi:MAG: hypothetical protein GYA57_01035 [Myxococcales bacterium]|nr:hypothetical protein [Myxococcales bacterium]
MGKARGRGGCRWVPFLLLLGGCDCGGPAEDECRTRADCPAGQVCEGGRCVAADASDVPGDDAPPECSPEGRQQCVGDVLRECRGGVWTGVENCGDTGRTCFEGFGCVTCIPDRHYCDGQRSMRCAADGQAGTLEEDCSETEGSACDATIGLCVNLCAEAAGRRSNVGCEYWAVDLDNWWGRDAANPDASAEQFALVVTNPQPFPIDVTVEINTAEPEEPPVLDTAAVRSVGPLELVRIDLPPREVDGSVEGLNEGAGTALTAHAYRVRSTAPIVAYQFNPVYQMHTNDASVLLPTHALDTEYRVLGYPGIGGTLALLGNSSNYGYLAVVGIEPGTTVTIVPTADVGAGGPVAEWTPAGTPIEAALGPFDVLNLEAKCPPEMPYLQCMTEGVTDFSGTRITASAPVAVFAGVECITVNPPGCSDGCCCDHLEEQLFPVRAWGTEFVAAHSPHRGSYDLDVWRILADHADTAVSTSLPAPDDSFVLGEGEFRELYAAASFTVQADHGVLVGQFLASQGCVGDRTGDPSFTLFPPLAQFRTLYTFLVPDTFDRDYASIVRPRSAAVTLDGAAVPDDLPSCTRESIGSFAGSDWEVLTCPLADGTHELVSTEPVGLMVVGYGPAGSYAYTGGTDLAQINLE